MITPGTSSTASSRVHRTSGGPQFASSGSFKIMPITNKIKQHQGTHYTKLTATGTIFMPPHWVALWGPVWVKMNLVLYHLMDIPVPATNVTPRAPSTGMHLIQRKVLSSSVLILTDIFFVPLTQNGFMCLLMPSQTANAPNRVEVMSTGLEIPFPVPIEDLDQPHYQQGSMRFQDNIVLVARVIPDEFIGIYGSLHFLLLVMNLSNPRVTLQVYNSLLQQRAFGDPDPEHHTTDPYEAYLVVPVIVDGVQFIGVGIMTKSFDLSTGDANDCIAFLQGFTSYWKTRTGSQDESGSGLVFLMSKISGHGLSPYPLPSWIVVDSCTVSDGLQPK